MALARLGSRALLGLDAPAVQVEVHLAGGLPSFSIVGLAEAEVREARDRVRSALLNCGFEFPSARRIVVNLAPADLPKESARYDLPIALGVLAAAGALPAAALDDHEFAGELSLSGELRPVRGALAMATAVAHDSPRSRFVLPTASAAEAALGAPARVLGAADLSQVVAYLCGRQDAAALQPAPPPLLPQACWPELADVRGQLAARRALEIAAAGGHHLLLRGPPGCGKSMLAHRLPGLLPPPTPDEALGSAALLGVAGQFDATQWMRRAFRNPHHGASAAALIGGGSGAQLRPGEVSLAHGGVLFLDELPEFSRDALESLREPLERGHVVVARARARATFPARFQMVAAMNPCPCGWYGHPRRACGCSSAQLARYRARLSGPLLDRIDLQVDLIDVAADALLRLPAGETSATVAGRVAAARQRQVARQGVLNARLDGAALDAHVGLDRGCAQWFCSALERLGWSARAAHRTLRVARSIADLAAEAQLSRAALAEAMQYRLGDE